MARVSQFVLFACIAIASSYTLPKSSQYDLEVPPEEEDLDNDQYDAYVDDFIAQLSPEELNMLKNQQHINVDDRDGNTGNCNWTGKFLYPKKKLATGEIIINSRAHEVQKVFFQTCNEPQGSCKPEISKHHYYGCCTQKEEKFMLYVLPLKDEKKILKEVYLETLCACQDYAERAEDLLGNNSKDDQCKYML